MSPYDPVIPLLVYELWESISTQKLVQNVCNNIIHSKQKLGTTQSDSVGTWPWNRKTSGGQESKLDQVARRIS